MVKLSTTKLRDNLADAAGRVTFGHERIVVERHGKPVCVLVSLDDLELLELIEDKIDIEEAIKALKRNKFVNWEQAKNDLGL